MTLTADMITAIRRSWATAEPQAANLLNLFYDSLFEMEPAVADMFSGTDMAKQQAKLGAALGLVVREVENPGKLLPALTALGRRHAEFGVTPDQYDLVGDVFCAKTRDAWATAYATVAGAMIAGADDMALKSA